MSSFISPIKPMPAITFGDSKAGSSGKTENSIPFADLLSNAINEYKKSEQVSEQDSNALATGNANNLAQIQIDSMKSQAALQTTVQLTSKMVTAYKEIMQMQV